MIMYARKCSLLNAKQNIGVLTKHPMLKDLEKIWNHSGLVSCSNGYVGYSIYCPIIAQIYMN